MEMLGYKTYGHYLENLVGDHSTPNGVYSIKFMWFQFREFLRNMYSDHRQVLSTVQSAMEEGRISALYLTRSDQLSQAISWAVAQKSGIWSQFDVKIGQRPVRISDQELLTAWQFIRSEYAGWEGYLKKTRLQTIRLNYENWTSEHRTLIEPATRLLLGRSADVAAAWSHRQKLPQDGREELTARLRLLLRYAP
jgi:LPS sulfotransferase NodH